ncbi:MAG TPA: CehA/McbA family metallohydrolase [Bacteroidota bacterium]|nr:CehA/McbA family metallohydrolase [Bacteroidota bacterium]
MVPFVLPPFLYAETHYRFPFFVSLLKKPEPEVVIDAPHRLEPGRQLPLLVLVKDAHMYPALLHEVTAFIRLPNGEEIGRQLVTEPIDLKEQWWWKVFEIDVSRLQGTIEVDVRFTLETRGKRRAYHNDNYRTSSRAPLRIYIAGDPLPRVPGLYYGDLHTHSHYTTDQVEYGSPPSASRTLSEAMGLSFFAVTDHSYDLDDAVDHYLVNDPELTKWKSLQMELDTLNAGTKTFVIIRGEEISCGNRRGKNVHLLNLGARAFLAGSGDSAERWFQLKPEHSIQEIVKHKEERTLLAAAHPTEPVPFLQKLLLGRDIWRKDDWSTGIEGFQCANGTWAEGFQQGKQEWISTLLDGTRMILLGGNDAHGNFNRFRQIGIPFFRIRESTKHIWGKIRTAVFVDDPLTEESILMALKGGRCIVTDGPVVSFSVSLQNGKSGHIGNRVVGKTLTLKLSARSSREFGALDAIRIYRGDLDKRAEGVIQSWDGIAAYAEELEIPLDVSGPSYLRAEAVTLSDSWDSLPHFCFTNPIWISP